MVSPDSAPPDASKLQRSINYIAAQFRIRRKTEKLAMKSEMEEKKKKNNDDYKPHDLEALINHVAKQTALEIRPHIMADVNKIVDTALETMKVNLERDLIRMRNDIADVADELDRFAVRALSEGRLDFDLDPDFDSGSDDSSDSGVDEGDVPGLAPKGRKGKNKGKGMGKGFKGKKGDECMRGRVEFTPGYTPLEPLPPGYIPPLF